jgi:hypothetical protein
MKLSRVPADQIVVVRHERHFAIAEAGELNQTGFGLRQVMRVMPGEWSLQATSRRDFRRLAAAVPADYVGTARSADGNGEDLCRLS